MLVHLIHFIQLAEVCFLVAVFTLFSMSSEYHLLNLIFMTYINILHEYHIKSYFLCNITKYPAIDLPLSAHQHHKRKGPYCYQQIGLSNLILVHTSSSKRYPYY